MFVERTADFTDAVNSGLSVGTPGTVATWTEALDAHGTRPLARVLPAGDHDRPRGFVVDETFAAADKPVAPGDPCPYEPGPCAPAADATPPPTGSTTHLVTADDAGNVVSYTFTIEQTGGSAWTVPGRGFILDSELTDFNLSGDSPNLAAPASVRAAA